MDSSDPLYEPEDTNETWISMVSSSAFLSKLWQMLNDPKDKELIGWGSNGRSVVVYHQDSFAKKILPKYFKHQKINSFIRQLNIYGFKKISKLKNHNCLNNEDPDQVEFANEFFVRGRPELIKRIQRRDKKIQIKEEPNSSIELDLKKLIERMSSEQRNTNSHFDHLKEENSKLSRQVSQLRRKHDRQQETLNRMISFMVNCLEEPQALKALKRPGAPLPIADKRRNLVPPEEVILEPIDNEPFFDDQSMDRMITDTIDDNQSYSNYGPMSHNGQSKSSLSNDELDGEDVITELCNENGTILGTNSQSHVELPNPSSTSFYVRKIENSLSNQRSTLDSIFEVIGKRSHNY